MLKVNDMKVKYLIRELKKQNQEAEVLYDGDGRWIIERVEKSVSDDNVVLISY